MDVLICGASGRAAAFSAARAGLAPSVADLFADSDLAALCPAHRITTHLYPAGLVDFARSQPPAFWLYTGALENHPDVVDAISRRHDLLGNAGATLRAVRDPFRVAELLRRSGLPCPQVRGSADGLPRDGRWLVKPLASAGGLGIMPLVGGVAPPPGSYFQQFVEGPSLSAVFVAHRAGSRLAGVTRQLVGRPGAPFAYVGSVGPWPMQPGVRERITRLGALVGEAFGLFGLFGIDFVLLDGDPWPVEINPRYTASVEVLELATGMSLFAQHVSAMAGARALSVRAESREAGASGVNGPLRTAYSFLHPPPQPSPTRAEGDNQAPDRVVGKAVVYAANDCLFPQLGPRRPAVADVPAAGTPIRAGDPVLTVFASGRTTAECQARLERRRERWARRLKAF